MGEPPVKISSLQRIELDKPPCCVEFSLEHPSYFLVGTYNLQSANEVSESNGRNGEGDDEAASSHGTVTLQERDGSIVAFRIVEDELITVQSEPQEHAILDLHFQDVKGKRNICGAVSSKATFAIFRFQPDAIGQRPLYHLSTLMLPGVGEDVLFTSFCWHPQLQDVVAITTTAGNIHVVKFGEQYQDCNVSSTPIIAHSLEAWHVAISPHVTPVPLEKDGDSCGPNSLLSTILSGGDDSMLQYGTCVLAKGVADVEVPFAPVTIKGHDAGVTAILPLPAKSGERELVVTGSYDDHIRLFSILPLHKTCGTRSAKLLAEENLGGGVWRIKLIRLESREDWKATLLVSCMHAGAKILEVKHRTEDKYDFAVLSEFKEHKSMNYGSDYQVLAERATGVSVVSVSFYDRLLCFWRAPIL